MQLNDRVRVEAMAGPAVRPLLPDLQRIRVTVFREWPYLLDGDPNAKPDYLRTYVDSASAAVVVAFGDGAPVGMSTCLPLPEEGAGVRAPFEARGWETKRFCYYGESVLLAEWRGQGIGVAFFEQREAHARHLGCDFAAFCAVIRAPDDPRRPPGDAGLIEFWGHRGYTHYPDLVCQMAWTEVGREGKQPQTLSFWLKSLTGAALP